MPIKPFNEWGNYEAPVDATNIEEGRLLPNYISDALRGIARGVKSRVDQIFPKVVFEKRAGHNELVLKDGESLTPVADYMFMMILDGDSGDDFPELGDDDSGAAVNVRINNVAISLMSNDEVQVLWRDLYWLQSPTRANNRFLCYFSDTTTMHILLMSFPKTRSIDNTHLADESVTSDKILDGEIITANIADDAITAAKIADNAVLSGAIADGAVLSGAIAEGAVLSGAIADGAVLSGAIANDAVTADKIADGAVPSLVVKRIAQAIITASDTLTYTSTKAGTSGNPINLRVSGQVYVDISVTNTGQQSFFLNNSDEAILTINGRNVGRGYFYLHEIDLGHVPGYFNGTVCLSFDTLFTFNSGSSHNLILAITSGKINTTYDNRIWVEELSEVVNLA